MKVCTLCKLEAPNPCSDKRPMPLVRCPEAIASMPTNIGLVLEANKGRTLKPGRITLADLERQGFF